MLVQRKKEMLNNHSGNYFLVGKMKTSLDLVILQIIHQVTLSLRVSYFCFHFYLAVLITLPPHLGFSWALNI